MRSFDDFFTERWGQSFKQRLLIVEVVRTLLISLKVTFDLSEEALRDICALAELFSNCNSLLEGFISSVHLFKQVIHISEHDRVKTNTDDHPEDSKDSLWHRLSVDISKPDCGQSLECPVNRL